MSAEPFDTDQVESRLRDLGILQTVEGAASYAAVRSLKEFRTPCAYVVLTNEKPDNKEPKAGQQRAMVTFGVVIAVHNYRDRTGGELKDTIRPILGAVRGALMGWKPDVPGGRPVKWAGGDVIDYDDNTLLWGEVYTTQHFIGAA